jgi:membrane-anchored protein YejM (alkaline phosphatase superfamily)
MNNKLKLGLVMLLVFSLFSSKSLVNGKPTEPDIKNAILIGWDGAQRNHIKEALARNELPNLTQLTKEGTLVAIDIYRTTDTKAGWSQILTGYEPEQTGVFSNKTFQPIPVGYTIFERLENQLGANNIFTAAVVGKKEHVDYSTGRPYANCVKNMNTFINGLELNDYVGKYALALLEKNKNNRFFFFVHFAEVDSKGHKYGENSKEYNDALISSDYWTGEIIKKLKELNLYESTRIYVTADHGFDEGKNSHSDAPYVFLGTNDKGVMRNGSRADITPTILDRLGFPIDSVSPALDGHSLLKPYTPPLW